MRSRWAWMLLPALLLLAGLPGCSGQPGNPKSTSTASSNGPSRTAGCQVERLDDAVTAVRQLSEANAYVYKIDGDLSTCRFEMLYKPDEESEEQIVYSANGDDVAARIRQFIAAVQNPKVHEIHHVLAIQIPEYPPQRDDAIVFSFSARCDTGTSQSQTSRTRTSHSQTSHTREFKQAHEILPSSFFDLVTSNRSSSRGPNQSGYVRPGKEQVIVDVEQRQKEEDSSGTVAGEKRNFIRYRVTIHCLADGETLTKDEGI